MAVVLRVLSIQLTTSMQQLTVTLRLTSMVVLSRVISTVVVKDKGLLLLCLQYYIQQKIPKLLMAVSK